MKKLISIIGLLAMLAAFTGLTGCGHAMLENGGAYAPGNTSYSTNDSGVISTNFMATVAPDYAFFEVESAFDFAYSSVNAAFTIEQDNRQLLWSISPDIKHALDKLRPQAVEIRNDYIKARIAYQANPIPANLSTMQTVLKQIQGLVTAVNAALPKTATK